MGKCYLETHLVDRVHSFHDSVLQKLEVTEFDRVVSTVVLQIFLPNALLESPSAGHGVSVHVGQLALSGGGSVAGGPGYQGVSILGDNISLSGDRRERERERERGGRTEWKSEH